MWAWLASCALGSEVRTEPRDATPFEAWLPEEQQAARWLGERPCASRPKLLPGLQQICMGRDVEGGLLAGLFTSQAVAGAAILVADDDDGAAGGTLVVAAADTLVYSVFDGILTEQRARGMAYVPLEAGGNVWAAPFRPRVFLRPNVLFGTLVLATGGIVLQSAIDPMPPPTFAPPNVFGAHPPPAVGYPALVALNGGLMLQVATAEEIAFRGWVQSGLARSTSELGGVALGSLIFGLAHTTNVLFMPPEDRVPYLLYAVPYITLTGTWLSWTYHREGYELGPSVAEHFWYNLAVSTAATLLDPEHHLFSLRFGGPF
jgi:membrane protease YdiL (CAAX protease family)